MQYPPFVRVAAVQITTSLDKAENLRAVERAVAAAGVAGADLVVFPEATMCSFGGQTADLAVSAEPLDGPFVTRLTRLAGDTGITIVAGTFEPAPVTAPGEPDSTAEPSVDAPAGRGRVRNTIVAVGPGGFVGAYRKFHLYDALGWRESDRIVPGDPVADGVLVFPVGDVVAGVMNCYDLRFPEMARRLVDAGATVLVEPAHWINGPGKADIWRTLLRARAIENTAYVVAAAKPEPECTGHSMVVDPLGTVLDELPGGGDGLVTGELVVDRVAEVRLAVPVLDNRRFAVVPSPPAGR